jgi:TPR repeat protein
MGQAEFSPSDNIVKPASLSERLEEAEANGDIPSSGESTSFSMAERFAPEGQKGLNEGPGRLLLEPAVIQGLIPARAPSANRGLLVASILVSLVPTAIILALLWQDAIRLPGSERIIIADDDGQLAASQPASVVSAPVVETVQPKIDIALTAPGRIEAKAGEEVAFDIGVDSADALPARSVIAIRAMPEGAAFSRGRPYGATEWSLRPDEIGDLRLHLPKGASGGADLRVELMAADGTILASATTRLDVAPDPRSALTLRSDESGRIDDLMAHGQKMVDVGYLAGARAYFRRAAEAGSGEAALALGDTYDPAFIDHIGAHGIKADVAQARTWYERARELGSEDAKARLEQLKNADDAQLTSVGSVPSNGGTAGSAPDPNAHASVDPAPKAGEAAFPAGHQKLN